MTKKEEFIKMVQSVIDYIENEIHEPEDPIYYSKEALEYFEELKKSNDVITSSKSSSKVEITENGIKILRFMQDNYTKYNNVLTSKIIAEHLFVSSRSVSGSMKKLISEGFVNKIGSDPVSYGISEKGINKDLSNI